MTDKSPLRVSFLVLDWVLGEDGVERWVGAVETTGIRRTANAPASDLEAAVNEMAAQARPERWVLMEGTTRGGERIVVSARRPLQWLDHPIFDLHTEVRLAYEDKREDGLPTVASLDLLRGIEDDISAALGIRGILVAHETVAGTRLLHYYSGSEDQNGRDRRRGCRRSGRASTGRPARNHGPSGTDRVWRSAMALDARFAVCAMITAAERT